MYLLPVGYLCRSDATASLGGDELGVIVEEIVDTDEVLRLAERILRAVLGTHAMLCRRPSAGR